MGPGDGEGGGGCHLQFGRLISEYLAHLLFVDSFKQYIMHLFTTGCHYIHMDPVVQSPISANPGLTAYVSLS